MPKPYAIIPATKCSPAPPYKWDYTRHIAIAKDYLGDNDDVLSFWVAGATVPLLGRVMAHFQGTGIMKGYSIRASHISEFVYNKRYWYDMVYIRSLNHRMCSENILLELICSYLKKECLCQVKVMTISKLLNS